MRRRILVDVDDTLCEGNHWTGKEILGAKPNKKVIDLVNQLYITDFIVIYTARQNHLIGWTLDWLEKCGVKFHAISNHKIPGDLLIDNLSCSPENLEKVMKEKKC